MDLFIRAILIGIVLIILLKTLTGVWRVVVIIGVLISLTLGLLLGVIN